MIDSLRTEFNQRYTEEQYKNLLRSLEQRCCGPVPFQVAETPVFLPTSLVTDLIAAGAKMTQQLVGDATYLQAAAETIPPWFRVPNVDQHPNFMTADFALVRGADGSLQPRLVELQAFPSLYAYQAVLGEEYKRCFGLDPSLHALLGRSDRDYWQLLRRVIVAEHDPEQVILMEVDPLRQKTSPDFRVCEDRLQIRTVDIAQVKQDGRTLFYEKDDRRVPIRRIYNRVIADDMLRRKVQAGFSLTADVDVEWAGHPAWYYLISKFSLPYLKHAYVPPCAFLDEWLRGEGCDRLPADRSQLVLKPLFSFAGKGIEFAPSDAMLREIPRVEQRMYLLQERQLFVPTVPTPQGLTQAEIRILYVWPADGELTALNTLVRLGRGAMMGVDHNRDQRWVGGSAGLLSEAPVSN